MIPLATPPTTVAAAVVVAASNASSVKEFNDQGNWGTVLSTAGATAYGAFCGYVTSKAQTSTSTSKSNTTKTTAPQSKVSATVKNDIIDLPRTGSALKTDSYHAFPDVVDNYAGYATQSPISNGMLYQIEGSYNGVQGRFEWIAQDGFVTHRLFVEGGGINGIPIRP